MRVAQTANIRNNKNLFMCIIILFFVGKIKEKI